MLTAAQRDSSSLSLRVPGGKVKRPLVCLCAFRKGDLLHHLLHATVAYSSGLLSAPVCLLSYTLRTQNCSRITYSSVFSLEHSQPSVADVVVWLTFVAQCSRWFNLSLRNVVVDLTFHFRMKSLFVARCGRRLTSTTQYSRRFNSSLRDVVVV